MARRRFFVEEVRLGAAEISGDEAEHLTRVLRVEAGQRYEISDNRSVYLAEIETARKKQVVFRVIEKMVPRPEGLQVTLCPALYKFDHFEWMVEKATELGVAAIVPFASARTERGLDRAADKRVERWRRIAVEASQQSRRDRLPVIEDPTTLAAVLARESGCRLLLDENPGAPLLLGALPAERPATGPAALALGPEGGWTDDERQRFVDAGWQPISLGDTVLRAETAALAAIAILFAGWRVE